MVIPTHSPDDREGANEQQGASRPETVMCSELQGNEPAEVAEMPTRLLKGSGLMDTREELAYLAGLMDADGCLALFKYPGRNRGRFAVEVFVAIKQTQREALDLLASQFGGLVRLTKPSTPGGKPLYYWKRSGQHAATVAQALLPFLLLKRRQAEIVIAVQQEICDHRFQELGPVQEAIYTTGQRRVRRYMISDASMARRQAWLEEIRRLNDTRFPIAAQQVIQVTD